MKNTFEIFITDDAVTQEAWQKLYTAIRQYSGAFKKFEIIVSTSDSVVRFFIRSDHDLSAIGNNLEGMVITTVDKDEVTLPHSPSKLRFLSFVAGGNLLDLKERYSIKKSIELEYVSFMVNPLSESKAIVNSKFYFKTISGSYSRVTKRMALFPAHLLETDFSGTNSKYLKSSPPKYLDIEKSMSLLSSTKLDSIFSVNGFPYFSSDYYINLNSYEFDKHGFIVGASGTGKSVLISLFIDRLAKSPLKNNYRVIVVDPHSSLKNDLGHIDNSNVIDFGQEGAELFSDASQDVQASTELTATLFKSLMSDQTNARLERVLRFSLFVLFTAQVMSLDNLKRFVTDLDYRNQMLAHVKGYTPDNIQKFFGSDFNEIRTQFYNEAIVPIVSLVDEMQLQPGMTGSDGVSLASTIQDNFLNVFSLNKVSMGEKVVKTIAGLILQQIFLLAQGRTFHQKLILIIDEVSIVQNPAMAQILAEARKFNLSIILAQQYFGQIEKNLQDAIFANTMNYFVFKVSEEDARAIEGNLSINLPKSLIESGREAGLKEVDIRVKMLTELNPRECLVRLAANGQIYPCVKAKTVDADSLGLSDIPQSVSAPIPVKVQKMPEKFVERGKKIPNTISGVATDLPNPSLAGPTAASTFELPAVQRFEAEKIQTLDPLPPEPMNSGEVLANVTDKPLEIDDSPINLSALLAEHSSGRKLVNERKAEQ